MNATTLKSWRNGLRLNQSQAARELGISRDTIWRMETGKQPIDRRTELACEALTNKLGDTR